MDTPKRFYANNIQIKNPCFQINRQSQHRGNITTMKTKQDVKPQPKPKPRPKPKDREALPFVACKGIILFSAVAAKYAATLGKN